MDIKRVSQLDNIQVPETRSTGVQGKGPSFADTLGKLQSGQGLEGLAKPTDSVAGNGSVKFSNHAVERMMSRGIQFSPEDMSRLNEAVDKAAAKGSKDSLVLMNDSALIVSVKNKTVVTVMDKNALKENVFTNIDSTIVM
jgi:flagellar operon protein